MKAVILLVTSLFAFPLMAQDWPEARIEQARKMVGLVQQKTCKRLAQKYHLSAVGSGSAMFGGPIRDIFISFKSVGFADKNDARRLIVACVNEMVEAAHEIPTVDHYLYSPPFTEKNTEIAIFFTDQRGAETFHPYIGVVSYLLGDIYYRTYNPNDKYCNYQEITKETYKEALEAIRKETEEYHQKQIDQG